MCTGRVSALSDVGVMMRAFILATAGSDQSKKFSGREDQSARITGDWYKQVRVYSQQSSVGVWRFMRTGCPCRVAAWRTIWEVGESYKEEQFPSWANLLFFFLFVKEFVGFFSFPFFFSHLPSQCWSFLPAFSSYTSCWAGLDNAGSREVNTVMGARNLSRRYSQVVCSLQVSSEMSGSLCCLF